MQVQKFYFDRIEFRFADPNDEKAIFEGMDWSVVKNISGAPYLLVSSVISKPIVSRSALMLPFLMDVLGWFLQMDVPEFPL
ncbi:MAG: hypothetical protein HYX61_04240 [Gammaproteobacteria bacterium]|jgi:hypothetical protein|nr:hypothetical protein [Gammaproteobacteria bacterium]